MKRCESLSPLAGRGKTIVLLLLLLSTIALVVVYVFLSGKIDAGEKQFAEGQIQLDEGVPELEAGKEKLEAGKLKLSEGKQDYKEAKGNLFLVWADKLFKGGRGFKNAKKRIAKGDRQIAAGEKEVKSGEKQVAAGKLELLSGRAQLRLAGGLRFFCAVSAFLLAALSVVLGIRWRRAVVELVSSCMKHPVDRFIISPIRSLGRIPLSFLGEMGRMGMFLLRTVFCAFSQSLKFFRVLSQIHFIGFGSVLVIVLTGAFTGMVLGFQGYYTLSRVGSTAFLGPMVALSLLRELGPVMTALMVTGRAGSAVAAKIGIMRITEQIDELEILGLSPYRYLVVPNLLAALISVPLLTAIFNVVGIYGGYLVGGKLLGVNAGTYFGAMTDYVEAKDVLAGLYKSIVFGGIIAWVCAYKGFYAGFGAEGVSRATTQAVVLASVLILVCDYILTSILF